MSSKQTAAGASGVGPNRRKWDVEEYTQKARDRDREEHERIQENEERQGKGQKPVKRRREELAKPTQDLQAREKDLELTKNEGKTLMVDSVPGGRKGPGFYCETCNRTFKDSIAYLDHVNGRLHLRKLGQTTQVARSTLEQVRARLQYWRQELQDRKTQVREYDFEKRLAQIAEQQRREKEERIRKRKEKKGSADRRKLDDGQAVGNGADAEAMAMMGFGSFGSSKKR